MSIPVLIVPILNRYDLLVKMFNSIDYPVDQKIVIDNGGIIPEGSQIDAQARVIRLPHNIGVSAAWNLGLKVTPQSPWWLIVNHDIEFGKGDLERLDGCVEAAFGHLYFMLGMAAFAVTRHTIRRVGYFDENFHPAYDEDLDFARRADLAEVERVEVGFTGTHVGSATIRADASLGMLNGFTHPANDRYYTQKWGGPKQGGETYSSPFNREGHPGEWRLDPERLRTQAWKRKEI